MKVICANLEKKDVKTIEIENKNDEFIKYFDFKKNSEFINIFHLQKDEYLKEAILKLKNNITINCYSIEEICEIYKKGEMEFSMNYDLKFIKDSFKSKIISHILLDIPLTQIVTNNEKKFKIINNENTIKIILWFMGELKKENGKKIRPFMLNDCEIIPDLEGFAWDKQASLKNNNAPFFSEKIRNHIKNTKITVLKAHGNLAVNFITEDFFREHFLQKMK